MNKLNHIAFIMDGNGRWGLKKKKSRNYGHLEGIKTVQKIVEASILFKIPIISLYVFSTENWKRPKSEINYLFNICNMIVCHFLYIFFKNFIFIFAYFLIFNKFFKFIISFPSNISNGNFVFFSNIF